MSFQLGYRYGVWVGGWLELVINYIWVMDITVELGNIFRKY